MGGHGGLNILPQKRWSVYNYENREKVRRDEEAAAREDQLKLEQSRRRDFEFRLEKLRQGRGLTNTLSSASSVSAAAAADSGHINLFAGLKDFDSLVGESVAAGTDDKEAADVASNKSSKKRRREDAPVKMTLEDEKYKLGYGLIGKGVQAPWYASKRSLLSSEDADEGAGGRRSSDASASGSGKKSGGKKTVEELREERMRREKQEKERERSLVASVGNKRNDRGFSRRRV